MKRFYRYLKSGKSKDEALRLAQIDLIHSQTSPTQSGPRSSSTGIGSDLDPRTKPHYNNLKIF